MSHLRTSNIFDRADNLERYLCVLLNNSSQYVFIKLFFRVISRLGDGIFWYAIATFMFFAQKSYEVLHIMLTGLCVLVIYKFLKKRLVRERPFINCDVIQQAAPALDRYSFPSGHTMHAVAFAIMFSAYLPGLSSLVWGFAIFVAMSRVILGLHYPTDIAAGALLGACIANLSLVVFPM